jgi:hypothetical protein
MRGRWIMPWSESLPLRPCWTRYDWRRRRRTVESSSAQLNSQPLARGGWRRAREKANDTHQDRSVRTSDAWRSSQPAFRSLSVISYCTIAYPQACRGTACMQLAQSRGGGVCLITATAFPIGKRSRRPYLPPHNSVRKPSAHLSAALAWSFAVTSVEYILLDPGNGGRGTRVCVNYVRSALWMQLCAGISTSTHPRTYRQLQLLPRTILLST